MNRISFRKKVSAPAPAQASAMDPHREAPPTPGSGDSWIVNEELLSERAKLVPSNPQDLSPQARSKFLQKTFTADKPWADLDYCQFGLGVALGVFSEDADFQHLKWIFWTENVVSASLNELVLALAKPESNCLKTRNEPDFQLSPV